MATPNPYAEGPFGGLSDNELLRALVQLFRNSANGTGPPITGGSPNQEFGGSKNQRINGAGSAGAGTVFAIYALTDTVITTVTAASGYASSGLDGATIPAGGIIYGKFSAYTQTSGDSVSYFL